MKETQKESKLDIRKIKRANRYVKKYFSNYDKRTHVYIDFVRENSFICSIQFEFKKDKTLSMLSARGLAEYAIEQIEKAYRY